MVLFYFIFVPFFLEILRIEIETKLINTKGEKKMAYGHM